MYAHPPDDPLYGRGGSAADDVLQLGQINLKGERGLLKISSDWLVRLRHNPFYDFLEARILDWVDNTGIQRTDRGANRIGKK